MKVCVLGLCYVVLTLALVMADSGIKVFGVESNKNTIATLKQKRPTLSEHGIEKMIESHMGKNLKVFEEIPDLDFDVFVIPSNYPDPFPRSVIEAMAFELPSIGFKEAGGIPESIEDGVSGFLCNPGDVKGVGDSILKLIKDPSLRKKMGVSGRKRVNDYYLAIDRTKDVQKNILEVLGLAVN